MRVRAFSDYHVHVRDGQRMKDVVPYTTAHCGRFMVMPNLNPHVINYRQMIDYREMIKKEIKHQSEVLMTISLVEDTTPGMIKRAAAEGCTAVKLYPAGVTTNSQCGISLEILCSVLQTKKEHFNQMVHRFLENLGAIENSDMVLCIHGELPGEEVLDRERDLLPLIKVILEKFKKIRVVLEHITTWDSVCFVRFLDQSYPGRVAATITPHHLMYTLTDMLGDKLQPHLFCKPVLKNNNDRLALLRAATSGRPCFFLGSDSAPWLRDQKECDEGCAGVWNAPVLASAMFKIFESWNLLHLLEDFTSTFGDDFYHKPHVDRYLDIQRSPWVVESEIHGIVPLLAGQTLQWRVME